MTEPLPVTDQLVTVISEQLPGVDGAQVQAVLNAWNAVRQGDPLGTVRRSHEGEVAHRVQLDGVHLWRVTATDGTAYNDMAPTLGWPQIYTPQETQ